MLLCSILPWFFGLFLPALRFSSAYQLLDGMCSSDCLLLEVFLSELSAGSGLFFSMLLNMNDETGCTLVLKWNKCFIQTEICLVCSYWEMVQKFLCFLLSAADTIGVTIVIIVQIIAFVYSHVGVN